MKNEGVTQPAQSNHDWDSVPTTLDQRCDQYMRDLAKLDPLLASELGLPGDRGALPDFSPAGMEAETYLSRQFLAKLDSIPLENENDQITALALRDSLGIEVELAQVGEDLRALNNIEFALQWTRDCFDLMDKDTDEDWQNVASRLSAVPKALQQWRESLTLAAERGQVSPVRQVKLCVDQARDAHRSLEVLGAEAAQVQGRSPESGEVIQPGTVQNVRRGVQAATQAYGELGDWLEQTPLPQAGTEDVIREFHNRVLPLGALPMSVMRKAMLD